MFLNIASRYLHNICRQQPTQSSPTKVEKGINDNSYWVFRSLGTPHKSEVEWISSCQENKTTHTHSLQIVVHRKNALPI